jgi:ABC-type dipeptide/oligopeptide/nickel transport system permease subunit
MAIRSGGTGERVDRAAPARGRAAIRAGQPRGLTRDALQRLLRNRAAVVGLAVIAFDVLLAICAPVLAPYSPTRQDLLATYASPSREHLLGTDALGRDVLSRTLYGARISMSVALVTVTLIVLIGLPLGVIAGYVGGALDFLLMRLIDALLSLPDILFVILITTYLNAALPRATGGPLLLLKELNGATGGLMGVFIALALFGWLSLCRLSRGAILALRDRGAGGGRRPRADYGPPPAAERAGAGHHHGRAPRANPHHRRGWS